MALFAELCKMVQQCHGKMQATAGFMLAQKLGFDGRHLFSSDGRLALGQFSVVLAGKLQASVVIIAPILCSVDEVVNCVQNHFNTPLKCRLIG